MATVLRVQIRACPVCGENDWWMAPAAAAGKHVQAFPPPARPGLLDMPVLLWLRWSGLGWWPFLRKAERAWLASDQGALEGDTARCANCGHEATFSQGAPN